MKKLSFEELDQISGGTTAETAELLELIKANPELNRTYNSGLKFHDGCKYRSFSAHCTLK